VLATLVARRMAIREFTAAGTGAQAPLASGNFLERTVNDEVPRIRPYAVTVAMKRTVNGITACMRSRTAAARSG
jgi:hypothetical protein